MKKVLLIFIILSFVYFIGTEIYHFHRETEKLSQQHLAQKTQNIFQSNLFTYKKENEALKKELQEMKQQQQVYTILVGGDLMLDRGVKKVIQKLGKDYHFPFEKIKDYLQSVDFVFANLEGSLSDVGHDAGNKYSFRFDIPVAQALADVGFDMVSSANNHMLDWGKASLCATGKNLRKVGIKSVGAGCNREEAEHVEIITLGNTKIAFLAYTEFHPWAKATETSPGMSEYNIQKIIKRVQEIKEKHEADLVFVSLHWGEEYKDRAPVRIVKKARELIDGGVDVIIGHHPHVDQEIERYKNGWIIYSLGNFVFDQSWSENTMEGLLAEIKVQNKKVLDIVPKFIRLNKNYQPELVKD